MSRSSGARQQRRALKSAGVALMDRVVIDSGAVEAARREGVNLVDLVGYHVGGALVRLDEQGGDIIGHCVVTIGTHPDFPGGVTVEAKVAGRKP